MNFKKGMLGVVVGVLIIVSLVAIGYSVKVKKQVKGLFVLNKQLQEEGYYMAEFEFRMLGFGYYLDKGKYRKALKSLSHYHRQLKNREGLIKVPDFNNKQEEINFYLNLQNPITGAFIDETVPFCTYYEISKNIIDHLVALSDSTTAPLKLKYPLHFLDAINTPDKLTAHLNDISYVGWLASRFPQTTFHFARNILGAAHPGNTLEEYDFYRFSPEWKHAMLKWMYEFQDTTTGMWGPKGKRTSQLMKVDLNNTASILKNFRDNEGKDRYEEFPLKYVDKLLSSSIEQLSESFPDVDDLAEIHEWNLRQTKGIKMLLRYLWSDATAEHKRLVKEIIERNIDLCFDKYYVEKEGAFSYYPNSEHASCDGNSNSIYKHIGAFAYEKQKQIWGDPTVYLENLGVKELTQVDETSFKDIINYEGVNSIRIYTHKPNIEHLTDGVWALYYPQTTQVLDVMELVPNILLWTETTSQSMGNWSSLARIKRMYQQLNIVKPLVFKDGSPESALTEKLNEDSVLFVVGFDKLQIPICKLTLTQ